MIGRYGCIVLLSFNIYAYAKINNLVKIHYHQKTLEDRLVCLFNEDQPCNVVPEQNDESHDYQHVSFFLPMAKISTNDVQNVLDRIENQPNKSYIMRIYEVTTPLKGIKVQIAYNKNKIGLKQEQFDAINTHKGVVFVLYHKDILDQINTKTNSVLHYAHNRHVPRIVIDYGHGGHDDGKISDTGIKEKDVTFTIGNQISSMLKLRGYEVIITRQSDCFVGLDDRTTFANRAQADVFLSIHANGAIKDSVSGIETYCFNNNLLKEKSFFFDRRLEQLVHRIDSIRDKRSHLLASMVHKELLRQVKEKHPHIIDRCVKEAVAQVLLGTNMPAILIELGFLSNKGECELLTNYQYQTLLSQGICEGIDMFFDLLRKQC